jgi:hypothetical protein
LRVGEIGKYPFRGLGDNVLTLRHGISLFFDRHTARLRDFAQASVAVFSCTA